MDLQLLVTGLGNQRIILGFPWLNEHNPEIDWKTGEFKWWTLQPLKVKRYHDKSVLQEEKPVCPIRTVKTDNNLEVKLHSDTARIPTQGSPDAAGYDLYSAEDKIIPAHGKMIIDTQISITNTNLHHYPTRNLWTNSSLKRTGCQKHDRHRSQSH